jgi:hypothetical protein
MAPESPPAIGVCFDFLDALAFVGGEFFRSLFQLGKVRPQLGSEVPTDGHESVVHDVWTEAGTFESFAAFQDFQQQRRLNRFLHEVRRLAYREHLPQSHSVRPHIRLVTELVMREGFRCIPKDWQESTVGDVVVVAVSVGSLRQTKVRDFRAVLVRDENVSAG